MTYTRSMEQYQYAPIHKLLSQCLDTVIYTALPPITGEGVQYVPSLAAMLLIQV